MVLKKSVKSLLDNVLLGIKPDQFIEPDPISIPKRYIHPRDIEISAFLTSILAWGQRKTIIANSGKLMDWMGNEPYRFLLEHREADLKPFGDFVHRTFNGTDCLYFIYKLSQIYREGESLESLFSQSENMKESITGFHQYFLNDPHCPIRTHKHIANPAKNSSAKRINMYLRWMVRKDNMGIDFGIWSRISMSSLMCPLDVHVQRAAMNLDLLKRNQQDWKAVEELSSNLRKLNPHDPIKYDLALFLYGQELSE